MRSDWGCCFVCSSTRTKNFSFHWAWSLPHQWQPHNRGITTCSDSFFNSMAMRFDAHDWNGAAAHSAHLNVVPANHQRHSSLCVHAQTLMAKKKINPSNSRGLVFYISKRLLSLLENHRQIYYYTERADASRRAQTLLCRSSTERCTHRRNDHHIT